MKYFASNTRYVLSVTEQLRARNIWFGAVYDTRKEYFTYFSLGENMFASRFNPLHSTGATIHVEMKQISKINKIK